MFICVCAENEYFYNCYSYPAIITPGLPQLKRRFEVINKAICMNLGGFVGVCIEGENT